MKNLRYKFENSGKDTYPAVIFFKINSIFYRKGQRFKLLKHYFK